MESTFDLLFDSAPGIAAVIASIAAAIYWKQLDHELRCWSVFGILSLLLTWAFMNSFEKVFLAWESPQYSHGYLIPVFTIALLYLKRPSANDSSVDSFEGEVPTWQQGLGLAVILIALGIRHFYGSRAVMTPDRVMFIPALLGVMLIVGGLKALRWSTLPILFLSFMYPFPSSLERSLLFPLKTLSTKASHFALETLGVECFTEGNRIMLDSIDLGVVDACSGLRMFTIFLALAGGIALVTTRPIWERVAIFLSAIPISLAVNSIRITLTGLAYNFLGSDGEIARIVKLVLHDFAGWIMMPMALGLLYLVYQILANVIIEEEPESLSPNWGLDFYGNRTHSNLN